MSVPQYNQDLSVPETSGGNPSLPSLLKHALFFGLLGPIFGCALVFLTGIAATIVFRGSLALTHTLEPVGHHPLQWLLSWLAGGYLYGGLPALATGACVAWFATLPFGKPRFTALTALTGWFLSFLYLFAFLSLFNDVRIDQKTLAAFVAGATGAAAALICLPLSRFLRR